ncbi:hypothetical protein HYPSUDRAFT_201396 [Hypholoma sublateritium FD-334 SS-4]|uniref:Uncharacterized protein n=1 Tax=Hypholoma sublateritium (strain FD-334 SS-4) TaxID=945553 RepID=A0A0D2L838_HYPSF|nr:hypothetical protein HYPSUDRAFT_201396 [Hypholoma sublateritium FD-334 SS-4]
MRGTARSIRSRLLLPPPSSLDPPNASLPHLITQDPSPLNLSVPSRVNRTKSADLQRAKIASIRRMATGQVRVCFKAPDRDQVHRRRWVHRASAAEPAALSDTDSECAYAPAGRLKKAEEHIAVTDLSRNNSMPPYCISLYAPPHAFTAPLVQQPVPILRPRPKTPQGAGHRLSTPRLHALEARAPLHHIPPLALRPRS